METYTKSIPCERKETRHNTDEADESAENREQLKIVESWEIPVEGSDSNNERRSNALFP